MNHDNAFRIIENCRNWNAAQTSVSLAFNGIRTSEDDVLDARRAALKEAWEVVASDSGGER